MAQVKWTFERKLPHHRAVILGRPEQSEETVIVEVPDDLDDDLAKAYVAAGQSVRPAIEIGGLRAEVQRPVLGENDDAEQAAEDFRQELDKLVAELKKASETLHEAFLELSPEALVWRGDPQEPDYHLRYADAYSRIYEEAKAAAEELAKAIVAPERAQLNWASWGSQASFVNLPGIEERIQEVREYVREQRDVIQEVAEEQHKERAREIRAREKANEGRFRELLMEQLDQNPTAKTRWERGFMSEEEEKRLVRDNLFALTRDWDRYGKITASDVCEECEADAVSFFVYGADTLTDAQFEQLLAVEELFAGDEWTVKARVHVGVCDCPHQVKRLSALVTWDIGPGAPKLSREFALDD